MSKTALTLLKQPKTTASACLAAVSLLCGESWRVWEPETLWLECNHHGVDIPVINRDKILAGRSLLTTGRFWYDMHAFERTAIAFSSDECADVGLEDAPIAYLNWAVFEATLLHKEYEGEVLEMDREPISYTAVQLFREGFVLAPEMLYWAQDELDKKYRGSHDQLKNKITTAWADAPKDPKDLDAAYPETAAGVQLARLASVATHFHNLATQRAHELARLKVS